MRFEPAGLGDAFVLDLDPREDERGFFARIWCAREAAEHGLETRVAQANLSWTRTRGSIRGLHMQTGEHVEAKLVRCVRGAIFDVAVDLRRGSSDFGRWTGVELSAENRRALYLPPGFAHGFQTLDDDAEVLYLVSEFYAPHAEAGLRFDDPDVGVDWPLPVTLVSERDRALPGLAAFREPAP